MMPFLSACSSCIEHSVCVVKARSFKLHSLCLCADLYSVLQLLWLHAVLVADPSQQ